jgi:hypothetical protein
MATNTKGLYDETVWEKFENRLKELVIPSILYLKC